MRLASLVSSRHFTRHITRRRAKGGALGTFKPGQMVKEFNDVVFSDEVGVVHGPIKTQFGYHLILIDERND